MSLFHELLLVNQKVSLFHELLLVNQKVSLFHELLLVIPVNVLIS